MNIAVRAIIIENNKILVMQRIKRGIKYYTLVGGSVIEGENLELALKREVFEETGLHIISPELVFFEDHPEPYNKQYIYICGITSFSDVKIQEFSEEAELNLNKKEENIHTPMWVGMSTFKNLAFRTPRLQEEIIKAISKDFPAEPIKIS